MCRNTAAAAREPGATAPAATSATATAAPRAAARAWRDAAEIAGGSPPSPDQPRRHLALGQDAPQRPRGVPHRPLVVEIEAVAVHREHEAVLVEAAGRELEVGLQRLLGLGSE